MRTIWKYIKWSLIVLVLAYIALVVYEMPAVWQKEKSDQAIARIQSQKLTMADVDGKHLPPDPDPQQADATVEGVDANQNNIRDDVELAIFKKHPGDIKLRAAELQNAIAIQFFIDAVNDTNSMHAALQKEDAAFYCLGDYVKEQGKGLDELNAKEKEVKDFVLNTPDRERRYRDIFENYMTSYGSDSSVRCDLMI